MIITEVTKRIQPMDIHQFMAKYHLTHGQKQDVVDGYNLYLFNNKFIHEYGDLSLHEWTRKEISKL